MHLYETLAVKVADWRQKKYFNEQFPAISEIIQWAANPDVSSFRLRQPQLRALETYWYLRLVEKTPHIFNLYTKCFAKTTERLNALGMTHPDMIGLAADEGFDGLVQRVKEDDEFVRKYKLEAVRETFALDYPSYIFALAMGAGKTVLIGAIFASEFAMTQEYPDQHFVENALVFAPGKTIIESLRELAEMRYEAILPPRMYKLFAASLKLTFTRDGDPTIPIIPGSQFNVVVTNTEKIRIQKETVLKSYLGPLFAGQKEDEARTEVANLRLQAIASLPNLAIFSDEAHHTYGQAMDSELKKVRKTVDYLYNPHIIGTPEREAHQSNLICVVNTTGTPYYQRQPLKDVVIWYGLSEGIRDGILKELSGNIRAFDFEGNIQPYLDYVIQDFFTEYGNITLPDGTPAKLAIFFPQTDDVRDLCWIVEKKMAEMGYSTDLILEHHTANENKAEFDRFRSSPKRVALLVSRGVEGWNVPALFGCALARRLVSGGNNFVLQAASRCLRQIPGNQKPARIYLSMDNRAILDNQLQDTYGETINDLNKAQTRSQRWTITLRKVQIPPLVVKKLVRTVVKVEKENEPIRLSKAKGQEQDTMRVVTYDLASQHSTNQVLKQVGDAIEIAAVDQTVDLFTASVELAQNYHLHTMKITKELKRIYPGETVIPLSHLTNLAEQIEAQTRNYVVKEETVEVALALVKPDGFKKEVNTEGIETYTAEILFPIDRQHLLTSYQAWKEKAGGFGFHYDPYNFDSHPEQSFFDQMLDHLNLHSDQVDDIYFTGAITDPQKTDFYVEYKGEDGNWHRYSPDFLIRRKDGRCLIVEIKDERNKTDVTDGINGTKAIATRKWVGLNPELLKYEMIFTTGEDVGFDQLRPMRTYIQND
ncbi:MAG: DEAD/DEAH box helicase family protein [Anaerolineaceae bacterium]|nr:DEAD/DEAH box helicase family protein [Anaerolineaceae bacterium]